MAWLRDDDDMLDHEKWRRAIRDGGDGVLLLWTRFRAWCSRRLTDGLIPPDMVDEIGQIGKSKSRAKQLRALIDARLLAWCDVDDDVSSLCRGAVEPSPRARRDSDALVVVGYLQRNPSRDSVLEERGRRAQAQKNYKDRLKVTGHPLTSSDEEGSGADDVPSRPVPARPGPSPGDPPVSPPLGDARPPDSPVGEAAESSPPEPLPAVREVFAEWQRVHRHPEAKLDAKRTARIRTALKLHTAEQLGQAIRGALKDDWLMGRDPKSPRKYDGLETLLRDTAQIERLIELERAPPAARRIESPANGRDRKSDVFAYAMQRISEEQAKESVSP